MSDTSNDAVEKEAKERAAKLTSALTGIKDLAVEYSKLDSAIEGKALDIDKLTAAFDEAMAQLPPDKLEAAVLEKVRREPGITALEGSLLEQTQGDLGNVLNITKKFNAYMTLCNKAEALATWFENFDESITTDADLMAAGQKMFELAEDAIAALKEYDPIKAQELESQFSAVKSKMSAAESEGDEIEYNKLGDMMVAILEDIAQFIEDEEPKLEALGDSLNQDRNYWGGSAKNNPTAW